MRIPLLSSTPRITQGNVMANLPNPKPKPVLGKAIGGALLIDLIGSWVGAEYVAQKAGFPTGVAGWMKGSMYWPWAPLDWLPWNAPDTLAIYTAVQAFSALAGYGLYKVLKRKSDRKFQKRKLDIHGSAHWADIDDALGTNLLEQSDGVYLGAYPMPSGGVAYLRHNGPEHIEVIAPTRSGKGVSIVLPTLLSWRHCAVVYDIKGELWGLTSGWRKSVGQKVLKFEPTAMAGSCGFNPLEEIRIGTDYEVQDVQNIATMIVDPDGKGLNDHWAKTGHALLVGSILHVLYSDDCKDKTLRGVASLLSTPGQSVRKTFEDMINGPHIEKEELWRARGWEDGTHPVVAEAAQEMLNKAENESSGVISTAMSFLTLYRDPIVAANTSKSDFRIDDLVNGKDKVTLYLVVPPSDADRLRPLIRLLINQILRTLTKDKIEIVNGRGISPNKHRLLFLIDEFPTLGKLSIVQSAIAFLAGYGIKLLIIIQDFGQLRSQEAYGHDESISANCHVQVFFAPKMISTGEEISKMAGNQTLLHETESRSGKTSSLDGLNQISQSDQYHSRPLITPDEAMRLPAAKKEKFVDKNGEEQERIVEAGCSLVFVAGANPIFGRQILYFKDEAFNRRSLMPAPPVSDTLLDVGYQAGKLAEEGTRLIASGKSLLDIAKRMLGAMLPSAPAESAETETTTVIETQQTQESTAPSAATASEPDLDAQLARIMAAAAEDPAETSTSDPVTPAIKNPDAVEKDTVEERNGMEVADNDDD